MIRLRCIAALIVTVGALPSTARAALPSVLTQNPKHPFRVRPSVIQYTGDGTGIIGGTDGSSARRPGRLRWTTYSHRHGVGLGRVWLDDCDPDCADGTFEPTPVRVHVFAPRKGHFTRLTLQYTFKGKQYTDRRVVRRYPGSDGFPAYWAYDIVQP